MFVKRRESVIEAELVARVRTLGGVADKVRVEGRRGFVDRLVVLPGGKVFFVEVKRPKGGRLSKHQMWYADVYRGLGVAIVVVRNSEDIDRLLSTQK